MPSIVQKIKAPIIKGAIKLVNSLSQEENKRARAEKTITPGMPELLRRAAAEGAVLLENHGALPLAKGSRVSLFGRVQSDWFATGYGSGGDINKPYQVNLADALRGCEELCLNESLAAIYEQWATQNPVDHGYWGHWPRCYPEMPLAQEQVTDAAKQSDCAVVVLGRASGEDRENVLEPGGYFLTDREITLLDQVTSAFETTIVLLNAGSVMDMAKLKSYGEKISAVLLVWQGGMESGHAAADLLCGKVSPCGKLSDTIAESYSCYPSSKQFGNKDFNIYEEDIYVGYRWFETFAPDQVLYPFGYGLSYGKFEISCGAARRTETGFSFDCLVKNHSVKAAGKEVVQIYVKKPCGVLGTPERELAAFAKTGRILPGGEEQLTLEVPLSRLSSYDAAGETGYQSAFVIEKGDYGFYIGGDVKSARETFRFSFDETMVLEQLKEACAPVEPFSVYAAQIQQGRRIPVKKSVPTARTDLKQRILDALPEGVPLTGDRGCRLQDVEAGRVSMEQFIAQLSTDELEAITRGDYIMNSPLGAPGNAGVFGGVLESLRNKGIPPVTATDGPSGIRLHACCSLIPIGTLLACTFDTALVEEVYRAVAGEMREKGSDVLLAPGMNIHRNPLCGRNFEYYSEDPVLTGKIAASAVKGLQSAGAAACPKHFACNNQEFNRAENDSRVSERALREIYLKGFEICLKEAKPATIMTSYNKINGVSNYYNYDLCTTILRNQWGYGGCVMTDWWMRMGKSPLFKKLRFHGYRVRAQVDVYMPGGRHGRPHRPDGTLLQTYGKPEGITLGEMQRSAGNVLRFVMGTHAFHKLCRKEKML